MVEPAMHVGIRGCVRMQSLSVKAQFSIPFFKFSDKSPPNHLILDSCGTFFVIKYFSNLEISNCSAFQSWMMKKALANSKFGVMFFSWFSIFEMRGLVESPWAELSLPSGLWTSSKGISLSFCFSRQIIQTNRIYPLPLLTIWTTPVVCLKLLRSCYHGLCLWLWINLSRKEFLREFRLPNTHFPTIMILIVTCLFFSGFLWVLNV